MSNPLNASRLIQAPSPALYIQEDIWSSTSMQDLLGTTVRLFDTTTIELETVDYELGLRILN